MTVVGIDFSLNSPGVCIQHPNGDLQFITLFNYGKRVWGEKDLKAFSVHKELIDKHDVIGKPYSRSVESKEFIQREREKIIDAHEIACNLVNTIHDLTTEYDSEIQICLEGFSYGSKGNSFIDIILYNANLRRELMGSVGVNNINIYQPSTVKKLAGKGNANKHFMIKAFQDDVLDDPKLRKSGLWNFIKDKDYSQKIPKPIDDLVDSYFLVKCFKD